MGAWCGFVKHTHVSEDGHMALLHLSVDGREPSYREATLEPFPGFRVIPWLSMRVEGEMDADYEPELEISFSTTENRFKPTFLGVRADEVNGTMLRTVRVTDYLRGAARLAIFSSIDADDEQEPLAALFDFAGGESIFGNEFAAWLASNGPSDLAIAHVGFSYVFALLAAEPPAKSVQRDLRLTARTADNWIARARSRGLLESAAESKDPQAQLDAWLDVMSRYEGMPTDE